MLPVFCLFVPWGGEIGKPELNENPPDMKYFLIGFGVAACAWGVSAVLADPAGAKPQPIHVGLCGREPPSMQTYLRRLYDHQQRYGGPSAIADFASASRGKSKLSFSPSDATVNIEGAIDSTTPVALAGALKRWPNARAIRINSFGGDAGSAMAVARQLESSGLELHVGAFCMSACANYLIASARKVVFDDSIVGFHSGPAACYDAQGFIGAVRTWGLSQTWAMRKTVQLDREYLASHPQAAEVILLSQRTDRGGMDDKPRDWLIASPELLGKLAAVDGPVTPGERYARATADRDEGLLGPIVVY